jgi:hypothetical protein
MRALILDAPGFVQRLRGFRDATPTEEHLARLYRFLRFGAGLRIAVFDQENVGAVGRRRHGAV